MAELTRLGATGTDELDTLHRDLLESPAHDGRPHVALNFVMTADGRVSFQGRAEIGTRTDRALMFHLRSLADAVMIGAGTLRVDPFAPAVQGRERQPLAIVVSRTCDLPLGNRFFAHPGPRLVATSALITAEPDARRLFEGSLRPTGTVRLERISLHESADGERYERSRVHYR